MQIFFCDWLMTLKSTYKCTFFAPRTSEAKTFYFLASSCRSEADSVSVLHAPWLFSQMLTPPNTTDHFYFLWKAKRKFFWAVKTKHFVKHKKILCAALSSSSSVDLYHWLCTIEVIRWTLGVRAQLRCCAEHDKLGAAQSLPQSLITWQWVSFTGISNKTSSLFSK